MGTDKKQNHDGEREREKREEGKGERGEEREKRRTEMRGETAHNHDAYPLPHPSRQRQRYVQPATL